ncbi:HAD family hydrolase [Pseudooceanicola sp. 502str34]|uniref:HAD family hydrolase n=1 Tax=Maritimibacter alkaliphilus TaxID=404236 RepID=UPI001C980A52|nr:HAD-IA family hydrolase [Maritimibacter alkaliphilus]MBY6091469.1 HAD-IA family hydrolase [Maritimibacter alkaliphilus]
MTTTPKLIIWDVDGTLSDSQGSITASMAAAFEAEGLAPPPRDVMLSIVGLTLEIGIAQIAPGNDAERVTRMAATYRAHHRGLRDAGGRGFIKLYDHIPAVLEQLNARPDILMAVATGKSRGGLVSLLEVTGLSKHFLSLQTADDHPSKPHPSMLLAAMSDCGVGPEDAVMIGDTSFDMDMGRAAGMRTIGVSWGFHPRRELAQANVVVDDPRDLPDTIDALWREEVA